MARIFLFPSESSVPCSNKLAESITENLETNLAIGELQIEDQIFGDDFTPISVPKSAFQGNICHIVFFNPNYFSESDHSWCSLPY